MQKIKIGIIGAAGYTGGELIRILLQHPNVTISFLHSRSNASQPVAHVHTDLFDYPALTFTKDINLDIDVLFLCLSHGDSEQFLTHTNLPPSIKIIDLGNDFRGDNWNKNPDRAFVYGLPEWNKKEIATATAIANPGCFATAIQLGLLPLAPHLNQKELFVTGITGSTGAGQALSATSHFSWRSNNIQPYKTLKHQHLGEIVYTLQKINSKITPQQIHFVPWRGDFARGIFVSIQLPKVVSLEEAYRLFQLYYHEADFVHVSENAIHLKQVINTNKGIIHLEADDHTLVVHIAIDNLLKGASGQAVQNMNLLFNWPETTGLHFKPSFF